MQWSKRVVPYAKGDSDYDELDTNKIHQDLSMRESNFNEFLEKSDSYLDST